MSSSCDKIRNTQGIQQGDPLGPLLFCLAMNPILRETKKISEIDPINRSNLVLFYLDDGFIIGNHHTIAKVIKLLQSPEVQSYGLYVNLGKCKIWWPARIPINWTRRYPSSIPLSEEEGVFLMNTLVGSPNFMESIMLQVTQDKIHLLKKIEELEDVHVVLSLTKNCFGPGRINHILGTTPPKYSLELAHIYDKHIGMITRDLFGGTLSEHT